MLSKLRSNFRLSNLIVKILFVITYVFCNWQNLLLAANMALSLTGASSSLVIPIMLFSGILTAVIFVLLIPFLTNLILNMLRLFNIPRAEYILLVFLFFDIGFLACGLLNVVNFFTPILLTWGGILFPFLVFFGCSLGFYKVTSKLYFNDVTRPYYFKNLAIIFFAVAIIVGVVL